MDKERGWYFWFNGTLWRSAIWRNKKMMNNSPLVSKIKF